MRRLRKAAATARRGQDGFTLIELLVATGLGLVVVGAAVTIFVGGMRSEPRTAEKVDAIQQGRFTVDRITRELRQGLDVPTATSSQLAIVTYVKVATCGGAPASTAIPCRVTYSCSDGTCTRTVAQPDGTGPGPVVQVASGLASSAVFTYQPTSDPSYVGVTLSFETDESDPITLRDGVALRNPEEA